MDDEKIIHYILLTQKHEGISLSCFIATIFSIALPDIRHI